MRKSDIGGPADGSKNSVEYFLRQVALPAHRLDVVGIRLVYLEPEQSEEYKKQIGV